jgi:hypothetical protein
LKAFEEFTCLDADAFSEILGRMKLTPIAFTAEFAKQLNDSIGFHV